MENRKIRSKKLNTRVDLTAMVSVSFLLIVFFMVTKELARPNGMFLGLSEKDPIWDGVIHCGAGIDDRVLTILLDDNDKMVVYSGILSFPVESPKEVKYGKDGIRKELLNRNSQILEYSTKYGRPGRGIIVVIKPSKKCNYKNLVDILDEMQIVGIETYTIVNDYSVEETKLLASN